MKVMCSKNVIDKESDAWKWQHIRKYLHLSQIDVEIGAVFVVYGVIFRDGIPWYVIADDAQADYPSAHCSFMFELIDSTIPSDWHLVFRDYGGQQRAVLLPNEWASDQRFMERLVNGDADAVAQYQKMQSRSER